MWGVCLFLVLTYTWPRHVTSFRSQIPEATNYPAIKQQAPRAIKPHAPPCALNQPPPHAYACSIAGAFLHAPFAPRALEPPPFASSHTQGHSSRKQSIRDLRAKLQGDSGPLLSINTGPSAAEKPEDRECSSSTQNIASVQSSVGAALVLSVRDLTFRADFKPGLETCLSVADHCPPKRKSIVQREDQKGLNQ